MLSIFNINCFMHYMRCFFSRLSNKLHAENTRDFTFYFLVLLTMHTYSNKCVLHLIVRLLRLTTQVTTPYQLKNMHLVSFSDTIGSSGKLIATLCIWPPLSNVSRVRASEASREEWSIEQTVECMI